MFIINLAFCGDTDHRIIIAAFRDFQTLRISGIADSTNAAQIVSKFKAVLFIKNSFQAVCFIMRRDVGRIIQRDLPHGCIDDAPFAVTQNEIPCMAFGFPVAVGDDTWNIDGGEHGLTEIGFSLTYSGFLFEYFIRIIFFQICRGRFADRSFQAGVSGPLIDGSDLVFCGTVFFC